MDWYKKEVKQLYLDFHSSLAGLTKNQAHLHLKKYGPNSIVDRGNLTLLHIFLRQFSDLLIIILIIAGFISLVVGEISDSIVIFLIVLLNALIGFIQEYKVEKSAEALKKLVESHAIVRRNGTTMKVSAENLVPGDILLLEEGMKIPADARILNTKHLGVDESTLTGESTVKHKREGVIAEDSEISDQYNMVFKGTLVTGGSGEALVVATGMMAEFGKIAQLASDQHRQFSPLQQELNRVAKYVAEFAIIISFVVFMVGIFQDEPLYRMFLYAISIAVAVVPEGLPATVTIALALGVQKLLKKNALVRQLSAVETLGSTMVICTDKTGTITKNEMTIKELFVNNLPIEVTGEGYSTNGVIKGKEFEELVRCGLLCNNAKKSSERVYVGDPTEIALVVLAEKADFDLTHVAKRYKRITEKDFDESRRMMSTVYSFGNQRRAYVKGAPHQMLDACSHILLHGKKVKLTHAAKERLLAANRRMGERALRVLALAYKDISSASKNVNVDKVEENLVFLGFVGMIDPPREGVVDSIEKCKVAGIKVMMITGDQPTTALAIAKNIGIVSSSATRDVLLTGKEISALSDKELGKRLTHVNVFARMSPDQKIRIVIALKKSDKVVAMTGDGVNDAPALKKADIGIAMGSGNDVSKEAANMILLDDSFATIVAAVKYGRGVYENIKKFILYVFAGILTELFLVLCSMFLPVPLAITAVQILWVDLGTEVLPALALSVDPIDDKVLQQKPRSRREHVMNKDMIFNILKFSIWETIWLFVVFLWVLDYGSVARAQTMVFTGLILFQMFNVFNCRSRESIFSMGIFSNKYLWGAVVISTLLQVCVVYLPVGNLLFGTVPLDWHEWVLLVGVAGSIIPYAECWKLMQR